MVWVEFYIYSTFKYQFLKHSIINITYFKTFSLTRIFTPYLSKSWFVKVCDGELTPQKTVRTKTTARTLKSSQLKLLVSFWKYVGHPLEQKIVPFVCKRSLFRGNFYVIIISSKWVLKMATFVGRDQFHQCSKSSFCVRSSWKRKKRLTIWLSFLHFWICTCKSCL
jgi:hypothetical protein